ncbi:hypothetical protein BCR36DRAFT_586830 [Piromyces finnis]|uniref:INTS8 TPR repeats domain-containing protein n=1 Tax=Piromyces finnis TaxID=1754191 RepID=A0A1Y1UXV3_9FUNG|nr:hypothetical protein BCR36DRAFT_586830 [Piromyces finnis]|eukprot:ORX43162.1 hypothetical protein BCR36DRAFT_586830 [Piromyces finnis]
MTEVLTYLLNPSKLDTNELSIEDGKLLLKTFMKKANFVSEPINDPSKLSERQILYLKLSYKIISRFKYTIQVIEEILPIESQAFLFIYYVIFSKDKINVEDVCNDPNILYKRWLIRNISKPNTHPTNYIIKEIRSLDGTDHHLQDLNDIIEKNINYNSNQEVLSNWKCQYHIFSFLCQLSYEIGNYYIYKEDFANAEIHFRRCDTLLQLGDIYNDKFCDVEKTQVDDLLYVCELFNNSLDNKINKIQKFIDEETYNEDLINVLMEDNNSEKKLISKEIRQYLVEQSKEQPVISIGIAVVNALNNINITSEQDISKEKLDMINQQNGELFIHILSMMTYSMDVKSLSKDLIFKIFKKAMEDNINNNIVKEKIINFVCQLCYYIDNTEYWNDFFENISNNYPQEWSIFQRLKQVEAINNYVVNSEIWGSIGNSSIAEGETDYIENVESCNIMRKLMIYPESDDLIKATSINSVDKMGVSLVKALLQHGERFYNESQYEKAIQIFNRYGQFLANQLESDSIHFQQIIKNTTIAQSLEKINQFYDNNKFLLMIPSMQQKDTEQEDILWSDFMNIFQYSGPVDLELLKRILGTALRNVNIKFIEGYIRFINSWYQDNAAMIQEGSLQAAYIDQRLCKISLIISHQIKNLIESGIDFSNDASINDDSKYSQLQEKTIEELRIFCFRLFDCLLPNTSLYDIKTLLTAFSDILKNAKNINISTFIGGCIAGILHRVGLLINLESFGINAVISASPLAPDIVKSWANAQYVLKILNSKPINDTIFKENVETIKEFIIPILMQNIYSSILYEQKHVDCTGLFCLADLYFINQDYDNSLKYFLNALSLLSSQFTHMEKLENIWYSRITSQIIQCCINKKEWLLACILYQFSFKIDYISAYNLIQKSINENQIYQEIKIGNIYIIDNKHEPTEQTFTSLNFFWDLSLMEYCIDCFQKRGMLDETNKIKEHISNTYSVDESTRKIIISKIQKTFLRYLTEKVISI